ncbi:MAG: 50S ribosomal protein L39e [Nanoarchaeota archaeon]|nr:50S ribosomal protein L39e [Nanoarchaeota archaeon]
MASNKTRPKKLRLIKAEKESVPAPFWAILRKFGKRRSDRWRLNPHKRRNWKRSKLMAD